MIRKTNRIDFKSGIVYIISEILGAIGGGLLARTFLDIRIAPVSRIDLKFNDIVYFFMS